MLRLPLYLRTLRHLRAGQVTNRVARRFVRPPQALGLAPVLRPGAGVEPGTFLPKPDPRGAEDRFTFLNLERQVSPLEYVAPGGGALWEYNFHYFDGLMAPGAAPGETASWVGTWLAAVPPGASPAWDPYPASRRILNWVKWSLAFPDAQPDGFFESLATQVRHLERTLEYHLLANHLLANAVALTAAGLRFAGAEGDAWLRRGSALLEEQLREQMLEDGAHFELSPAYHALIVEDLLDLVQMARAMDVELPTAVAGAAQRGLEWLRIVTRPDGRFPLFNDAAYGVSAPTRALIDYAERLDLAPAPDSGTGLVALAPSGHFRYREGRVFLVGDVGGTGPAYQPGHTHCDMLSFELGWDGVPLVVDTGTSTYEVGGRRRTERGTAAHNTVQVDDLEQHEIWASFRIARRGEVEAVEFAPDRVVASIRAFPPRWARLTRSWRFDGEAVTIEDVVNDGRARRCTARLHFHPEVDLQGEAGDWCANGLEFSFQGHTAVRNVEYHYAPEFNRLIPARCLEIEFDGALTTVIRP